jgi:hypothetical protein
MVGDDRPTMGMGGSKHEGSPRQTGLPLKPPSHIVGDVASKAEEIGGEEHEGTVIGAFESQGLGKEFMLGAFGGTIPASITGEPHRLIRSDANFSDAGFVRGRGRTDEAGSED